MEIHPYPGSSVGLYVHNHNYPEEYMTNKIVRFEGGFEWHIRPNGRHWLQISGPNGKPLSKGEVVEKDQIAWVISSYKDEHYYAICQADCNCPMVAEVLCYVGVAALKRVK